MAFNLTSMKNQLEKVTTDDSFGKSLHDSIDKLLRIGVIIKKTHGESGWSNQVLDANKLPVFDPSEQSQIESTLQPIIPLILYILGEIDTLPQKGGAAERFSVDKVRNSVIGSINSWNKSTQDFAADSGILKMESSATDLYPFAPFVAVPGIGPILSQIPVSPKAAIFFAYLAFELTRIFVASPYPAARSTMSIMIAIIDLLRGDWKKAILSFAGYYSENALMAGVYGKIFLTVYSMISPDIRDSIAYGVFDVAKSIIIGTILQVVQLFSPAPVRESINQGLAELHSIIIEPEEKAIPTGKDFEGNPLPQKKDYYRDLDFEDIQNIQAILRDPTRNCSKEFRDAISSLKKSPLIENLLQLLGVPTLDEDIYRMCGKDIPLTYVNTLAENRLKAAEAAEVAEVAEVAESENIGNPTAAQVVQPVQVVQPAQVAQPAQVVQPAQSEQAVEENPIGLIGPQSGGYRKLRNALIFQS